MILNYKVHHASHMEHARGTKFYSVAVLELKRDEDVIDGSTFYCIKNYGKIKSNGDRTNGTFIVEPHLSKHAAWASFSRIISAKTTSSHGYEIKTALDYSSEFVALKSYGDLVSMSRIMAIPLYSNMKCFFAGISDEVGSLVLSEYLKKLSNGDTEFAPPLKNIRKPLASESQAEFGSW